MLKSLNIHKGVNLGGWLSQCDYTKEHLDTFITEQDFAEIAGLGFDHIRIPVDFNLFQNNDGTLIEDGFSRLDNAFALSEKYNMRVILDLHKTAGFSFDSGENESGFFDNEKYQNMFYQLWEAFAKRYGSRPGQIVFELLNEVTDAEFIDAWNRIADICIARIRVYAPDTIILVGSYFNNSVKTVPALNPPKDAKVMYNFHCYEPLVFTHQGATWAAEINPDDRMPFSESGTTVEYFTEMFAAALEKAKAENTSLYCGEYGIIQYISPEDTVAWFKVIHAVFEQYDIPRAVWTWKGMHFGIADTRLDAVRDELLRYL
ncbi:MAG: glycoside hydrolase family 5 protein [Oscillospiraceae bacterium]|nr:glycoside hydrolase family 5 protein [Oscillospiraceae bacterium]